MYRTHHLKTHLPYFSLFLALFVGISSQAQVLRPNFFPEQYVIGSAGGFFKAVDPTTPGTDNVIVTTTINTTTNVGEAITTPVSGTALWLIEWTIGEIFVDPLQGSRKRLTQGFHQYLPIPISPFPFLVLDQEGVEQHFSVFPNPFVNNLSVNWNFEEDLDLLFEVYSLDGKRVFSHRHNATASQLLIQLNNLKPQTYILRVSDPSRGFLETHKIVKL
jgi:hypothetical protein